jgi:hypothetical protein
MSNNDSISHTIDKWASKFKGTLKYISVLGQVNNFSIHFYYFDNNGVDLIFFKELIKSTYESSTVLKADELDYINFYPNPIINSLSIENTSNNVENCTLIFRNIQGIELINKKIELSGTYRIDMSGFADGVYIISLKSPKRNISKKVVLQKQ